MHRPIMQALMYKAVQYLHIFVSKCWENRYIKNFVWHSDLIPKCKASLDGQNVVYQGPDTVLSSVVSGSTIEYTNISLSSPETRKPSEITEGTAYQGEDRADFNLRKPIYNEENNKEVRTYQGPDIPISSCNLNKNKDEMEEQCPEYEGPDTLPASSSNSLNTANNDSRVDNCWCSL